MRENGGREWARDWRMRYTLELQSWARFTRRVLDRDLIQLGDVCTNILDQA